MLFHKKIQTIEYSPNGFMRNVNDTEPLCYVYPKKIEDKNAVVLTGVGGKAYIKVGSEFKRVCPDDGDSLFAGNNDDIKLWKSGVPVTVYFSQLDKPIKGSWHVEGSNITKFRDERSDLLVSLKEAFGSFEIKINEPKKFIHTVVGSMNVYRIDDLVLLINDYVSQIFCDELFNYIKENNVEYVDLITHFASLAKRMMKRLNEDFTNERGFSFMLFSISNETIVDYEDAEVHRQGENKKASAINGKDAEIRKIMDERDNKEHARYIQEKQMDNDTVTKLADAYVKAHSNTVVKDGEVKRVIICPHCHKENPMDSRFCSGCGTLLSGGK